MVEEPQCVAASTEDENCPIELNIFFSRQLHLGRSIKIIVQVVSTNFSNSFSLCLSSTKDPGQRSPQASSCSYVRRLSSFKKVRESCHSQRSSVRIDLGTGTVRVHQKSYSGATSASWLPENRQRLHIVV